MLICEEPFLKVLNGPEAVEFCKSLFPYSALQGIVTKWISMVVHDAFAFRTSPSAKTSTWHARMRQQDGHEAHVKQELARR